MARESGAGSASSVRMARELTVDVPASDEAAAVAAVYALGVMGVQLRDADTGAPPGRVHVLAWLPPTDATAAAAEALAATLAATLGATLAATLAATPGATTPCTTALPGGATGATTPCTTTLPGGATGATTPSTTAPTAVPRGATTPCTTAPTAVPGGAAGARVSWRDVPVTWDLGPAAHPVGARFAVVAPGAPPDAAPGRDPIVIEAALAFGDGLHPTTALCVEALERLLAGPRTPGPRRGAPGPRAPRSLLDVGTGTGILAVVAARLGAASVVACDIDPLAVWAARRTVAANHVDVTVGDTLPAGRFDLVVANLYLASLLALLPTLATRLAPEGALLLSGFVRAALPTVTARCDEAGLSIGATAERDGWVACVAQVPP